MARLKSVANLRIVRTGGRAAAAEVTGPCERRRELSEKHKIQTDADAPAVTWAYDTACGVTG